MRPQPRVPLRLGLGAAGITALAWALSGRRLASLLAALFWHGPARTLAGTLWLSALGGLALHGLTLPLLSLSLWAAVRLGLRKTRLLRRDLAAALLVWGAALCSLAALVGTSIGAAELEDQAVSAWADLRGAEALVYEGPLVDFDATDTWTVQPLHVAGHDPQQTGRPQRYRLLLAEGTSFLCPPELARPLAAADCSLYRWQVSYLPRTGIVRGLAPCPAPAPGPEDWVTGGCVYPKTHGQVPSPTGQPVSILGYDALSAHQRRMLDLLVSGRLEDYVRTVDGEITWDDSLTDGERRRVLVLYETLANSLYGEQTGLEFWNARRNTPVSRLRPFGEPHFAARTQAYSAAVEQLAEAADRAGEGLSGDEALRARLFRLAELLAERTAYREGTADSGNGYGALVRGEAKCDGYAQAYAAAAYRLGVPCGVAVGPSHAWNVVWVDGEARHIDVTWMDNEDGTVDEGYFWMTTAQREETLRVDTDLAELAWSLGVT